MDVRSPAEFREGHVPGARNVPASDISRQAAELDGEKDVVACCRSGQRSERVARRLSASDEGPPVANMAGGYEAWTDRVASGNDSTSEESDTGSGTDQPTARRTVGDDTLQAKLTVSHPDDPYEREAERVAQRVMQMPPERRREDEESRPAPTTGVCTSCQRRLRADRSLDCEECEKRLQRAGDAADVGGEQVDGETEQRIQSVRGGGRSLTNSERSFFEPRFGRDFSDVRVHTGPEADEAARSINAEAFTVGRDVAFAKGNYRPGTTEGKELMAHELTHVVQQGGAGKPSGRANRLKDDDVATGGDREDGVVRRQPTDNENQKSPSKQVGEKGGLLGFGNIISTPLKQEGRQCTELDPKARTKLADRLQRINSEIQGWQKWREGKGWGKEKGHDVPDIGRLGGLLKQLITSSYQCKGTQEKVSADDPLVKRKVFNGVGKASGVTQKESDYIAEWMSYVEDANDASGNLAIKNSGAKEYFRIEPKDVKHTYQMQAELSVDAGLGVGGGGKLDVGPAEVALGCYPEASVGGQWLEFSYNSSLGMSWSAEYAGGSLEGGGECKAEYNFDTSEMKGIVRWAAENVGIGSSLGSWMDACKGDTGQLDTYYGPGDFAGARFEGEAGGSVAAGAQAGYDLAGAVTLNTEVGAVPFNMTGACYGFIAGVELGVSASASAGGQWDVTDPAQQNKAVKDVSKRKKKERTVAEQSMYYGTGSSDPLKGEFSDSNAEALQKITEKLQQAGAAYPPEEVSFLVTGHASPQWEGAESEAEARKKNRELALERANKARQLLHENYKNQFDMETWPGVSTEVNTLMSEDSPLTKQSSEIENRGTERARQRSMMQVAPIDENAPTDRRVTIEVKAVTYASTEPSRSPGSKWRPGGKGANKAKRYDVRMG